MELDLENRNTAEIEKLKSNAVTLTETQTITGGKTFEGAINIDNKNPSSSTSSVTFSMQGSIKGFLTYYETNNDFVLMDNSYNPIELRVKTLTNVSENSNKVATTSWVRNSTVKIPNYNSFTSICDQSNYSTNLPYTCTNNGWIILASTTTGLIDLKVNGGLRICTGYGSFGYFKVAKGDILTYSNSGGSWNVYFSPDR